MGTEMRSPLDNPQIFKERRRKLAQLSPGSAFVLMSNPEQIRNSDVHQLYRQDSNFYYLTGYEEPHSIFIFRPGKIPESILFTRPKDPALETWEGFRYGPDGAKEVFLFDATYTTEKFEEVAPSLLNECDKIYYQLFFNADFDRSMQSVLQGVSALRRRSQRVQIPIFDPMSILAEMRLVKSDWEIEKMRQSCEISALAHIELMKHGRAGENERSLYARFLHEIMRRGAQREAYPGIFASGNNATTLHYIFNDQPLREGELVLVDAGGELNYYASDITRCFPVSKKFSPDQKRVYGKILDLQKKLISLVQVGQTLKQLQELTRRELTQLMIDEGLLKGSLADLIKSGACTKYYPHGVGHWLGMDVHDVGALEIEGEPRKLQPGMVLTIEPGLYVPAHDESAPKALRGLGIRIEDDVVVTDQGPEVLTSKVPKDIDEIEELCS